MSLEVKNSNLLFQRLARSAFRSRFHLSQKEIDYIKVKGIEVIEEHAHIFIQKRLAEANPQNDGKQTPFSGHPVFIAQHATATCCRGCLEKWYSIPIGNSLLPEQIDYIVAVILKWIKMQIDNKTPVNK